MTLITKSRSPLRPLPGEEHREERDHDDDERGDPERREHDDLRDRENEAERDREPIPVLEFRHDVDPNARVVTRIRRCHVEREGRVLLAHERRVGSRARRVSEVEHLEVGETPGEACR